ncbi:MAG TPA: serine protease [Acidimicrobiales bacterium]|jgi:S1-C subfamily serine protease
MLRAITLLVVAVAGVAGAGWSAEGAAPHPERAVVAVETSGCHAVSDRATGWVGPGGLVVTVAHAVRGSTAVIAGGVAARVVGLDLRSDVAVLAVSDSAHVVGLTVKPGETRRGAAWVAHLDDGRARTAATSTSNSLVITIDEPADDTTYTRRGLSMTFGAKRGDSGAPVVDRAGTVVGMVFATARADAHLSYAVSAAEIAGVVSGLTPRSPSVPTGRCA